MRALASIGAYMTYGLDLQPNDVFWNIADPGWPYGLDYAVNFAGAPTAYRFTLVQR